MRVHILIVDDEAPVRFLLSDFFHRRGHQVTVAGTATEMWHALDSAPIHLVVLDIDLEDEDGLKLLATIKQTHPRLPVIMLTGMGYDDELEEEALEKGAAGYVSKTLPLEQLLMEVHRVVNASQKSVPHRSRDACDLN
ncbi:MAG: response regulator [Limisphaerales bacterium]